MKTLLLSSTLFSSLSYASTVASSAPASSVAASSVHAAPGNLLQIIVSLVVVVGVLILLGVAFKKIGLNRIYGNFPVKLIGGISIGTNQRIMVIEVGDEWVVLGVTPHTISNIASMPRQENNGANGANEANDDKSNFPAWMKSALEKYQGRKS